MRKSTVASVAAALAVGCHAHVLPRQADSQNTTYTNPVIPGYHPDPSCIFVPEWDDTFFCAVSSFIAFPAMPVFASKDLINWRLISHVQNRPEQSPSAGNISRNDGGWYAPTLRYHEGVFYVINVDVDAQAPSSGIFTTEDPYDDAAWSDLLPVTVNGYDPDIFFDSDGTVYSQFAKTVNSDPFTTEIHQFTIDLPSGTASADYFLTNGTAVQPPEGPQMYYKDRWYWLVLAEGGTALDHQVTVSRSRNPTGPWELGPNNPVLTANPTSLFQTVGQADLFQDSTGNWWGVALATRSGPEYVHWPMNRETVLYPVSWPEGEWPVFDQVEGIMEGPLPAEDLNVPGDGPFVKAPDHYSFPPRSSLPKHFTYWRFPQEEKYTISPRGHPNTLRLLPSNANLTAFPTFDPLAGQTFVGRRQVDTLFKYSVDMKFTPKSEGEEAGATIFLRQERNAVLGLIYTEDGPQLRFKAEGPDAPATVTKVVPRSWAKQGLRFEIEAVNFTHYEFSAGPKHGGKLETIAYVDNALFSTSFTGVFAGIYATTNGNGEEGTPAYFSNWKYQGLGQAVAVGEYVPSQGQQGSPEVYS